MERHLLELASLRLRDGLVFTGDFQCGDEPFKQVLGGGPLTCHAQCIASRRPHSDEETAKRLGCWLKLRFPI